MILDLKANYLQDQVDEEVYILDYSAYVKVGFFIE